MARENHHSIYGQKRTEVSAYIIADFDPLYKATPGVEPDTGMFTPRYWNVGKVVEEAKGLCDRIREAETTLQAQR